MRELDQSLLGSWRLVGAAEKSIEENFSTLFLCDAANSCGLITYLPDGTFSAWAVDRNTNSNSSNANINNHHDDNTKQPSANSTHYEGQFSTKSNSRIILRHCLAKFRFRHEFEYLIGDGGRRLLMTTPAPAPAAKSAASKPPAARGLGNGPHVTIRWEKVDSPTATAVLHELLGADNCPEMAANTHPEGEKKEQQEEEEEVKEDDCDDVTFTSSCRLDGVVFAVLSTATAKRYISRLLPTRPRGLLVDFVRAHDPKSPPHVQRLHMTVTVSPLSTTADDQVSALELVERRMRQLGFHPKVVVDQGDKKADGLWLFPSDTGVGVIIVVDAVFAEKGKKGSVPKKASEAPGQLGTADFVGIRLPRLVGPSEQMVRTGALFAELFGGVDESAPNCKKANGGYYGNSVQSFHFTAPDQSRLVVRIIDGGSDDGECYGRGTGGQTGKESVEGGAFLPCVEVRCTPKVFMSALGGKEATEAMGAAFVCVAGDGAGWRGGRPNFRPAL